MVRALITTELTPQAQSRLRELGFETQVAGFAKTRRLMGEKFTAGATQAYGDSTGALLQGLPQQELIQLLAGTQVLICMLEEVGSEVMAACPELRLIGSCWNEPINVDVAAATERGILVLHTRGHHADSVADYTLALLLAEARSVARAERHLRQRGWMVNGELPHFHFRGPELSGKTLGLIGFGEVGRKVAARAKGFSMRILVHDPYVTLEEMNGVATSVGLDRLLSESDFVSLHCAVTEETRNLIGDRELSRMKQSAYLINTARAALIDEGALLRALELERIAGAALDVFWEEPIPSESPFLQLPNVTLTPHIAGSSVDVVSHHSNMLLEDIERVIAGQMPLRVANPEVLVSRAEATEAFTLLMK